MTSLRVAMVVAGLGCLLSGRSVAELTRPAAVARGAAVGSGARVGRSIDPAWVVRLAPIAGAAAGTLVAGAPGLVIGAVAGIAAPRIRDRRRAATRTALLEDQLAEAVSSIAAGVRAGLSLTRALAFAAGEADAPLAASLAGVADRIDLGTPLEHAVDEWADSIGSSDARLLAGVLDLHRRTGGELPSVLDELAATLRERRAAAREVRALTAQARLSGAILGLLPIGFFLFLSVTSRDDITAAFHSGAGMAAISIGLTMQGLAFVWIRSLLKVDG